MYISYQMSYRWRCVDCLVDVCNRKQRREHCCCPLPINCPGHNIKVNYCAGKCLDCGWCGCVCTQRHCCCEPEESIQFQPRTHQWIHQFIDKNTFTNNQ